MEEQHPIPQNVTGFQFKLIGDMTIRQFAYLAGNILVAYIFYLLIPGFLKWSFVLFFVFLGILLAFIPYQGRPLDKWIVNFFRAVFSNSRYVFQVPARQAQQPQITTIREAQVPIVPETSPPKPRIVSIKLTDLEKPKIPVKETQVPEPQVMPRPFEVPKPTPVKVQPVEKVIRAAKEELVLKEEREQAKRQLEEELQKLIIRKGEVERDITKLRRHVPTGIRQSKQVTLLNRETAPALGIPNIPQFPNLLSGIVKDIKGNVLPGILIEVKDKDGALVRAFKTNKLGGFSAATTLPNGTYILQLEDPQGGLKFDVITLNLIGQPVSPLEIKNLDAREELRRRVFNASS